MPPDLFHSQLSGVGVVHELERRFADYYGKRYALAVANATLGLYAVSMALDLSGREVVTTPLSWGGTIAGALAVGARVRFSDVDSRTLALCADEVAKARRPRTAAVLAVDFHGVPADDEALRRVADEFGWWYIHDAAQSFGAQIHGRPAGSCAHVIVTSLSAGKGLSAGEGGVIMTDDADLYARLVWLTQHPDRQKRDLGFAATNEFALNMRINPLAAWWGVTHFDMALQQAHRYALTCNSIVRVLDGSGLSVPLAYESTGLIPGFFRLTATWRGKPDPAAVVRWLTPDDADDALVRSAEIVPLYRKPRHRRWRAEGGANDCPVTEKEAAARFEVVGSRPVSR